MINVQRAKFKGIITVTGVAGLLWRVKRRRCLWSSRMGRIGMPKIVKWKVALTESLRCKTSTPTWTSKSKLLYLFLQGTEHFRFWWVSWILDKLKKQTNQVWNEFSCKILEPVWRNITLLSSVLPFSIQLKTYAFHVVKRRSKISEMHEANYWDKRSFKLWFLHIFTALISVIAVFVLWSLGWRSRSKIVSSLIAIEAQLYFLGLVGL